MSIKIKGIEQLDENLKTFKDEALDIMAKGVFQGAVSVMNDAKQGHGANAHDSGRYQDITSNLTNSIQAQKPEVSDKRIKSEVIAGMEYAAVVELGGTHTTPSGKSWESRPYPYLFPALEKNMESIKEGITNLLKMIRWIK